MEVKIRDPTAGPQDVMDQMERYRYPMERMAREH